MSPGIARRLAEGLAAVGSEGWVHARDIDTDQQVGLRPDVPVPLSSVAKVPLLVAFLRQVDKGRLDATEAVRIPATGRTAGLTGLSVLVDPVVMSLRDLATLMITVSDNASADVLFETVGLPVVAAELGELGLSGIVIPATMAELASDPARSSRASARDLTDLLARIWRDEAASPQACAAMRRMLGLQVWPHRLSAGFPADDVVVSGKTGSLPFMRHEIGVVEYPDGGRYAVAVLTRSASPAASQPLADAAIGTAARTAITALRSGVAIDAPSGPSW